MKYRVILWDNENEFDGYGYHPTKRLAKKHAKQLARAFAGRAVSIFGCREGYLVWHKEG